MTKFIWLCPFKDLPICVNLFDTVHMHIIQYLSPQTKQPSVMDPHRGAIPCRYMTPGSLWASATGNEGPFDVGNIQGPKIIETFIHCYTSTMDPPAPQSQLDGCSCDPHPYTVPTRELRVQVESS